MLERKDILAECVERCLTEMYKYSQPSLDFKNLLEQSKQGKYKDNAEYPLYKQHYLSTKNYIFILNHYLDIYGLFDFWKDSMDIIINNFTNGGIKNIYIPEKEDGTPGYKDYEKIEPLKYYIGEDNADTVLKLLKDYKDFYKHGQTDYSKVYFSIALGCSPCSNKDTVIEYWETQNIDLVIKDIDVEKIYYGDDTDTDDENVE